MQSKISRDETAKENLSRGMRVEARLAEFLSRLYRAALRAARRTLFRREDSTSPKKILAFRTGTIGDMVCALPAIDWLKRAFPDARVTLLTTATGRHHAGNSQRFLSGAPLIEHSPAIDDLIVISAADLYSLRQLRALRRAIRALDPDATYLLPRTGERPTRILTKLIFLRLLGARRNLRGYEPGQFFTPFRRAQFLTAGFAHQVSAALEAVGAAEPLHPKFPIAIPQEARERIEQLWREERLEGKRVIGMFPSGKFEHKRWPIENFSRLCQTLKDERETAIVVLGGPHDQELARRLEESCGAINLAGRTSLLETAEVLRRCALYVGNDSGPAHLAAAMGTPCVTLFSGVAFPGIWEPWGEKNISLRHPVACQYCFSEDHCPRGTTECIRGIAVEEVAAAAKAQLRAEEKEALGDAVPASRSVSNRP